MIKYYDDKAAQTLGAIERLHKDGINKISVLLRHAERNYTKDSNLEAFMSLTEKGKTLAFDFGRRLPEALLPEFSASFIGRCIETAYLIDKGYTSRYGNLLVHPVTDEMLSPFYVRDVEAVVERLKEIGDHAFLKRWFSNQEDTDVIDNPQQTANRLCNAMTGFLDQLQDNEIRLCVSHDWNIYPLKEFKLNQPLERTGDVGYMEGVLFFKDQGRTCIMGIDSDPIPLDTV